MINVERLAQLVAKTGGDNILIHCIPGTKNWIVCQKIEKDSWLLTLMDPQKSVSFNLGTVSNKEHLSLWKELVSYEIAERNKRMATEKRAENLHSVVQKFIHINRKTYGKFIKADQIGGRATKSRKSRK